MWAKLFNDILTGSDNKSFDHGRVLGFFSYIVYFGLEIWSVIQSCHFDPVSFAGGISAIAVGFGVHLKLKSGTEPGDQIKNNEDLK